MVADPKGRGFFIVKVKTITPGNALNQPGLTRPQPQTFTATIAIAATVI